MTPIGQESRSISDVVVKWVIMWLGLIFRAVFATVVKQITQSRESELFSESSFPNWLCLLEAAEKFANQDYMAAGCYNCHKWELVAKHPNCYYVTMGVI